MRIVFLPQDMDAPGCYRCLFPARQLREKAGFETILPPMTVHDLGERRHIEFHVHDDPPMPFGDIWVLQARRERTWAETGMKSLRQHGVVSVVDLDDNYEEIPEYNPAFYGTHPYIKQDGVIVNREARRKLKKKTGFAIPSNLMNREHMHSTIEQADVLTVSTPYLADLYRKFNPRVHVLRNYLDWDIWNTIIPQYKVNLKRTRIGYLGAFKYRRADLEVIKNVIPRVMKRHPEVDFVANTQATHDFLGVPPKQRVTIGEYDFWPRDQSEDYEVGRRTAVLDIGLVPLAMNGLNQAKSHLKGMEYNAAGAPFIATPTDSYKNYWCEQSKNGWLAESQNDWEELIEMMIYDDSTRRLMGHLGRRKAEQNTIQEHWHRWSALYHNVLGDKYTMLARGAITRGAVQKVSELSELLAEVEAHGKPKVVVEVGSARGGTFWAFSQIADPKATMVSIDIPSGSPLDMRGGKDVYSGRDRDRFKYFVLSGQELRLLDADSQDWRTKAALQGLLADRKIDFLFIDADHRYEGVKRDFELYSPLVRDGGLIAFHDIQVQNDPRSGVHHLWAELRGEYETQEFIGTDNWGYGQWGGIGLLRKEPKLVLA